jgi:hypothetical protein
VVHHPVPTDTVVPAIDGEPTLDTEPFHLQRIHEGSGQGKGELDLAGDTTDRQITHGNVLFAPTVLDLPALEVDFGVVLHIQEVGASQMVVPLLVVGKDAAGIDRELDGRPGGIVFVDDEIDGVLLEAPPHVGDPKVAHPEPDLRVIRIHTIDLATLSRGCGKKKTRCQVGYETI